MSVGCWLCCNPDCKEVLETKPRWARGRRSAGVSGYMQVYHSGNPWDGAPPEFPIASLHVFSCLRLLWGQEQGKVCRHAGDAGATFHGRRPMCLGLGRRTLPTIVSKAQPHSKVARAPWPRPLVPAPARPSSRPTRGQTRQTSWRQGTSTASAGGAEPALGPASYSWDCVAPAAQPPACCWRCWWFGAWARPTTCWWRPECSSLCGRSGRKGWRRRSCSGEACCWSGTVAAAAPTAPPSGQSRSQPWAGKQGPALAWRPPCPPPVLAAPTAPGCSWPRPTASCCAAR